MVGKPSRGVADPRRLHADLATVRREVRCACENVKVRLLRLGCRPSPEVKAAVQAERRVNGSNQRDTDFWIWSAAAPADLLSVTGRAGRLLHSDTGR